MRTACSSNLLLTQQSPDIAQGVDARKAKGKKTARAGRGRPGLDVRLRQQRNAGADAGADHVRAPPRPRADQDPQGGRRRWLRPDAKSQVSVIYEDGKPVGISNVVISTQHAADASHDEIEKFCIEEVIRKVLPARMLNERHRVSDQPDRPLRRRRAAGRHRPHRPQDHRRQLRRHGPSRRRRVLGQGSDEGRSQRRLHGPLGREERRRRGARGEVRSAVRLRDRPPRSGQRARRDVRHRRPCRTRRSSRAVNRVFNFQPAGDHRAARTCAARSTRRRPTTVTSARTTRT